MRVSVGRDDDVVVVDGRQALVDCSGLPSYIHAIQWDEDRGWIEFKPDVSGRSAPNMRIVDFGPYSFLVDRWRVACKEKTLATKQFQAGVAEQEATDRRLAAEQRKAFEAAALVAEARAEEARREKLLVAEKIAEMSRRQAELEARLAALGARDSDG